MDGRTAFQLYIYDDMIMVCGYVWFVTQDCISYVLLEVNKGANTKLNRKLISSFLQIAYTHTRTHTDRQTDTQRWRKPKKIGGLLGYCL